MSCKKINIKKCCIRKLILKEKQLYLNSIVGFLHKLEELFHNHPQESQMSAGVPGLLTHHIHNVCGNELFHNHPQESQMSAGVPGVLTHHIHNVCGNDGLVVFPFFSALTCSITLR